jgi:hypothetical protein
LTLTLALALTLSLAITFAATTLSARRLGPQFLGTEATVTVFIEFAKRPHRRADLGTRQLPIAIPVKGDRDGIGRRSLRRPLRGGGKRESDKAQESEFGIFHGLSSSS